MSASPTMFDLILSARSSSIQEITEGFRAANPTEIEQILRQAELWFGPRPLLESDPKFRQIIPYVVIVNAGKIVAYERHQSSSERRLHGQLSIGLGGHIGLDDAVIRTGQLDIWGTVLKAADRELDEELSDLDFVGREWHGIIADNSTAVGRVHLGLVAIFVSRTQPTSKESAVCRPRLMTIAALARQRKTLEPWSAIVLAALGAQLDAAVRQPVSR